MKRLYIDPEVRARIRETQRGWEWQVLLPDSGRRLRHDGGAIPSTIFAEGRTLTRWGAVRLSTRSAMRARIAWDDIPLRPTNEGPTDEGPVTP